MFKSNFIGIIYLKIMQICFSSFVDLSQVVGGCFKASVWWEHLFLVCVLRLVYVGHSGSLLFISITFT